MVWDPPVRSVLCNKDDLADKLYAARPLTWRGRGDLVQIPAMGAVKGTWLILDLWSGIGGLLVAALSLGMHCYAVTAESDSSAAACVAECFPNAVAVSQVAEVHGKALVPFLKRRNIRGILAGGGSPCQGNSALNSGRKGLQDERSCEPIELFRLRAELEALPEAADLELVFLLENVASMPDDVSKQYSMWMHGEPVLSNAAACGWTQRKRLYWLTSKSRSLSPEITPPPGWDWETSKKSEWPVLQFKGPKPIPPQVSFLQGYLPLFEAKQVVATGGVRAMHPFTREFYHPTDRVQQSSPAAVERFFQDNRRFPPSSYEEESLLWRQDAWRQPLPEERCQMMGLPPGCVAAVKGSPPARRAAQNSLIGNGFHIPTIMALLCMMPALLDAKISAPLIDMDEAGLRSRCLGTVWEPGRLEAFPDLMEAADVVTEMQAHFDQFQLPQDIWLQIQQRLQVCDLRSMQRYVAWQRLRGQEWHVLGPYPLLKKDRASIFASFGDQRYPGDSSKGLDHLLPPGLGPEEHVIQAQQLPSPFRPKQWPEDDVLFVLEALVIWRQFLPSLASSLRKVVTTLATAVQPLREALWKFRNSASKQVASDKDPAFLSLCTALLRWPDVRQPLHVVQGYPIIGEVESTGVFRAIDSPELPALDTWLGEAAKIAADNIMASRPPRHHEEILKATKAEIDKGFCSELRTRSWFDSHYGEGQWRPLERFIIQQSDGKFRVIDNCKRTLHNHHTRMKETIYTINVDFVAAVFQMLAGLLQARTPEGLAQFEWLCPRLGTEDLPDAYRGLPVQTSHLPYSVISVYDPSQGWRFSQLWGLAFGLESAVVAFNRFPTLGVAATRRFTLGMAACYFDDQLALEMVKDSDVSRQGLLLLFNKLGAPPQAAKSFRPSANRHYLGTSVHVGDVCHQGIVRFQPKSSTREKIKLKLQTCLQTKQLDPDTAGKIRGDLNWLFSQCAGFAGKMAGPLLAEKQKGHCPSLDAEQLHILRVLLAVVTIAEPRDIAVVTELQQPTIIYSDASFEDQVLRLGWIIFPPGAQPYGGTSVVPPEVIAQWADRKQQIFPGETLAALLIPYLHGSQLRGVDILWFIDNCAAVASLVRHTSSQIDVHNLSQYSHLLLSHYQCRCWYEWIDSHSNPSDGLSRDGLKDSWTLQQGWNLAEYSFPPCLSTQGFLDVLADMLPS